MLAQDQREVRALAKAYKRSPKSTDLTARTKRLCVRSLKRTNRTVVILDAIGSPTIEKIGADGAEAMSVIALHSKYSVMKKVLRAFQSIYKKEPQRLSVSYSFTHR